jgi:hypothetical protein
MKFEQVISDVKKLVGIKIQSINPGADITLLEVDEANGRLELLTSLNARKSRPLGELRRIWEELCRHKAVHVDSVVGGSGSSRNQPETILANLPYVEWLRVNRRKHLSFVGQPTHALGKTKQMDRLAVHSLIAAHESVNTAIPSAIIVVEDSRPMSDCLEDILGLPSAVVELGVYRHGRQGRQFLVVNQSSLPQSIPVGVYVTIAAKVLPIRSQPVKVANTSYCLVVRHGVNFLVYNA